MIDAIVSEEENIHISKILEILTTWNLTDFKSRLGDKKTEFKLKSKYDRLSYFLDSIKDLNDSKDI
jgi:hypothetical protein